MAMVEPSTHRSPGAALVSVMVPAYNAAKTIRDCLDSVALQSHRPIELIIINDGSTDDTELIARTWIQSNLQSEFGVIFRSQDNQGLLLSRQLGVELSSGAYLQFLDADDLLHRDKLKMCVEKLSSGEFEVTVPRTEKFFDGEHIRSRLRDEPRTVPWSHAEIARSTITSGFWHSVGPLFTRQIIEAVGPFSGETHPVAEELEFHARVKLTTKRVCYIPEVLNFYRKGNPSAITGALARLYEGRIEAAAIAARLLRKHHVRSAREWISLLRMSMQTYYQALNCCEDPHVTERAWKQFQQVACAWSRAAGAITARIPRSFVDRRLRKRFAKAAGSSPQGTAALD